MGDQELNFSMFEVLIYINTKKISLKEKEKEDTSIYAREK